MNARIFATVVVAGLLLAGSLFLAKAQAPAKPQPDPRIEKLIEQNDKILKNQEEMLKSLNDLREGVLQLRRRTS